MDGLLGYWPLESDFEDHSGAGRHGVLGARGPVEVPDCPALALGQDDFSLSAWVWTERDLTGPFGDFASKWDGSGRRGFTAGLGGTAGGYNSLGDARYLRFSIDSGTEPCWEDHGRPNPGSNYVNSLTVFEGGLYVASCDAEDESDWRRVFHWAGGDCWEDCGQVGSRRNRGVGGMVVHRGSLFAAIWNYDWTRVHEELPLEDDVHVWRYLGGQGWEDCGQPGSGQRLFSLASFAGDLYAVVEDSQVYRWLGDQSWEAIGELPHYGHPMGVHEGRLYVGTNNPAGVWAFDGRTWDYLGNPQGAEEVCNQVHSLESWDGALHATTWPLGHVMRLEGRDWLDLGRLGATLEINALAGYNGKLYGGSIPFGEVFRFDGVGNWTLIKRFHEPAILEQEPLNDWTRVTSLSVFAGRLFATVASCTGSVHDAPLDYRGKVFSLTAGQHVVHDTDLGPGWKSLVCARRAGRLEGWVDGKLVAQSPEDKSVSLDLSNSAPLLLGGGPAGPFAGKLREVRLFSHALVESEIAQLVGARPG